MAAAIASDVMAPLKDVRKVQFGILSPDEIRCMSVTEGGIKYPETHERGHPKIGGLMDPHQGVIDRNSRCLTCHRTFVDCPGHFGHIELAEPVFHVGFITKTVKILNSVCFYCSKLRVSPNNPKMKKIISQTEGQPEKRLSEVHNLCKDESICRSQKDTDTTLECDGHRFAEMRGHEGCEQYQPTIKLSGLDLNAKWKYGNGDSQKREMELSANHVQEIFKHISDEECSILGMNPKYARPEWMIVTVLPVPPLFSWFPIDITKSMMDQDLIQKFADIVNANNGIITNKRHGAPAYVIKGSIKMLQFHVATLFDNEIAGVQQAVHKSGRPLSSLKQRLKNKEGGVREHLMEKRTHFCASSVVTPDPNLRINEVGVPQSIAHSLTIQEIVNPYNLLELCECVRRGPHHFLGARCITRGNGDKVDLTCHQRANDLRLKLGYRVERSIKNGDVVVMSNQPVTTHNMSAMSHRIKVLPYSTFRMNLSAMSAYNIDSEMNLHVPQSLETRAEVEQLESAPMQVIGPFSNKPVFRIVEDTLTAISKMTKRDVFLEKDQMMNLIMHIPWDDSLPVPAVLKPKPLWTGKQLFSLAIPATVDLICTHSTHPDDEDDGPYKWISPGDTKVVIERGELLSGIVCRKTVDSSSGSLVRNLFDVGYHMTSMFYDVIEILASNWLLLEGHTISIGDIIADPLTYINIAYIMKKSKEEVIKVIQRACSDEQEPVSGKMHRQTFENQITHVLNDTDRKIGATIWKSLPEFNNFKAMVVSGASGSKSNLTQVIACIGQQFIEGKRIPFGFRKRTLPHFVMGDGGPESRGFIQNCFVTGLTPSEFFFHAMKGRESLVNSVLNTTEIGYIQRRLMRAMENVMVAYDGTVRSNTGHIIQFLYGEDGLDGGKVVFQPLLKLNQSDMAFEKQYRFDATNERYLRCIFTEDVVRDLLGSSTVVDEFEKEWNWLKCARKILRSNIQMDNNRKMLLPCNLQRMIKISQNVFRVNTGAPIDLSPLVVIQGIEELVKNLVVVPGEDRLSVQANKSALMLFRALLHCTLCTKRVAEEFRLSSLAFEWLLYEIKDKFQQAQVHPGEMVGALAARSFGVSATRMVNTTHYASISAKNVTLGIPRLKEIIDVSKKPKTPSLTVFLNGTAACGSDKAKDVMRRLEHTTLRKVTANTAIYYDPDPQNTMIVEDREFVSFYYGMPDIDIARISPWLLRIELDRGRMTTKNMSMEHIAEKIFVGFGDQLNCIFSDDNAEKLIFQIRIMNDTQDTLQDEEEVDRITDAAFLRFIQDKLLDDITLQGVEGITKVYLRPPTNNKKRIVTETEELEAITEWYLETDGTNLIRVLGEKDVDPARTYSNDIHEVFTVLGIEAVRKVMEKEMYHVLTFDGSYINYRHLALLCDFMTYKGCIMAIPRHGISKQNSPLMRCSFEETVDKLVDAASCAEVDHLTGVSERIIMGQLPRIGTGAFDLVLDSDLCGVGMQVPVQDYPGVYEE